MAKRSTKRSTLIGQAKNAIRRGDWAKAQDILAELRRAKDTQAIRNIMRSPAMRDRLWDPEWLDWCRYYDATVDYWFGKANGLW